MRKPYFDRLILVSVIALLIGLGLWMQLGLLTERDSSNISTARHQPDYYIKNFLAKGQDGLGTSYVLRGALLQHFLNDSTVDIKMPCLLMFEKGASPRLVFADTGRVIENGTMIVFHGDVEVREHMPATINESAFFAQDDSSACFPLDIEDGTWTRTDELMIQLKPGSKH